MNDLLRQVEERRLALGLSQSIVADRLSISQPHYSKVVGGVVSLTAGMAESMTQWLASAGEVQVVSDRRKARISALTWSIEQQLRELNSLVGLCGGRRSRRVAKGKPTPAEP